MTRFAPFVCLVLLCLFVAPADAQFATCLGADTMPPHLAGGSYARISPGVPNNIRQEPGVNAPIVGQVQPGELIYVTTAPRCVDGLVWWQVGVGVLDDISDFGWTAGGADGVYWLEQVRQPMVAPEVRNQITAANAAALVTAAQAEYGLVNRLAWSQESSQLAVSAVGAVWVYNFNQPGFDPLRYLPNPADTNATTDLAFNIAENRLFTVGGSSVLEGQPAVAFRDWMLSQDGASVRLIDFQDITFNGPAAISPDGTLLAAPDQNGTVVLYTTADAAPVAELPGHALISALRFTPDGRYLISAGGAGMAVSDAILRVWEVATGAEIAAVDLGTGSDFGFIQSVTVSADGALLGVIAGNAEGSTLQMLELPALTVRQQISFPLEQQISALSLNASGTLAFASIGRPDSAGVLRTTLEVYDVASGAVITALPLPGDGRQIALSPDDTLLAVAYADPLFWGPDRVVLYVVP